MLSWATNNLISIKWPWVILEPFCWSNTLNLKTSNATTLHSNAAKYLNTNTYKYVAFHTSKS